MKIETQKQLEALIGQTYMHALYIAIAAIVVAYVVANLIKWQGGRTDNSHIKRRIWFIIIGMLAAIIFLFTNQWTVVYRNYIPTESLHARFIQATVWASLSIIAVYGIVSVLTMFLMRGTKWGSKWGSILGKSEK